MGVLEELGVAREGEVGDSYIVVTRECNEMRELRETIADLPDALDDHYHLPEAMIATAVWQRRIYKAARPDRPESRWNLTAALAHRRKGH